MRFPGSELSGSGRKRQTHVGVHVGAWGLKGQMDHASVKEVGS